MFRGWFTPKYRIKEIAVLQISGDFKRTYRLQHKYPLWPFWIHNYTDTNRKQRRVVNYFYNADPIPDHIPINQKDRYLFAKEKVKKGG